MKYREGLEGCIITFHLPDERWDEDEAREAKANQALITHAPLLYAEVERLREQLSESRVRLQQMGTILDNHGICGECREMWAYEKAHPRYGDCETNRQEVGRVGPTREQKIERMVNDDIEAVLISIGGNDYSFLDSVLKGDGFVPYSQLTDEQVDAEFEGRGFEVSA